MEFRFARPPIGELGMTVQTGPRVMDNYDVRELHDFFRAKFPKVERRETADITIQTRPSNYVEVTPDMPLYRWWFLTESGAELLQFQEDLIGRNWRRQGPPSSMPNPYPGYEVFRTAFEEQIRVVRSWRESKQATFPAPRGCELLYDNYLSLEDPSGDRLRVQDVLAVWRNDAVVPMRNLNLRWGEDIEDGALLLVEAGVGGLVKPDGGVNPIVRLMLAARKQIEDWDAVLPFFDRAHDYIRKRLLELTTDQCHASWEPK